MENTLTLNDDQMVRRFQTGLAVSVGVNALAVALAAWSATVTRTTTNPNTTPPEFSLTITTPAVETSAIRHTPIPRPVVVKTATVRPQPEARRIRRSDRPQPRLVARPRPVAHRSAAPAATRPESVSAPAAPALSAPVAVRAAVGPQGAALRAAQVRSLASAAVTAPAAASVSAPSAVSVAPNAPRLAPQSLAPDRTAFTAAASERITMDIVAPRAVLVSAPTVARKGRPSVAAASATPVAGAPTPRSFAVSASSAAPTAHVTAPGRISFGAIRPAGVTGGLAALPTTVGRGVDVVSVDGVASVGDRVLHRRAAAATSSGIGGDARTSEAFASATKRDPQVRASSRTASETTVEDRESTGVDSISDRPVDAKLARTNGPGGNAAGENRDAVATSRAAPQLSAEQKRRSFKGQVQAEVTVDADGSLDVRLVRGSGDDDIDAAILSALRRWSWKPALRNGEKVRSTQQFRYDVRIAD